MRNFYNTLASDTAQALSSSGFTHVSVDFQFDCLGKRRISFCHQYEWCTAGSEVVTEYCKTQGHSMDLVVTLLGMNNLKQALGENAAYTALVTEDIAVFRQAVQARSHTGALRCYNLGASPRPGTLRPSSLPAAREIRSRHTGHPTHLRGGVSAIRRSSEGGVPAIREPEGRTGHPTEPEGRTLSDGARGVRYPTELQGRIALIRLKPEGQASDGA
ncbi:hypothetical protein CYMTET_35586 [Cymbomonas tetramitiformis]|uniref:Uncharacterized protein n=1 Tax=Cymbomonas tetramitiformis TaxID=36881 RepID=A0AAE0F919_9CHLO|nr:hypothetical protein CYMTET_35586 [Cymbomonas tetramitiformis]